MPAEELVRMPDQAFADTNLFLPYLTNDIPAQDDAVERLLDQSAAAQVALRTTPGLKVREESLLLDALEWYADKNVDFVEAYNAAWMRDRGLNTAFTFDRKHFARFDGIAPQAP